MNDWDTSGDNGMSKAVPEAAHGGKLGLRITDASEVASSSLQSIQLPVVPGKTYQLRFWARTVSGAGVGVYLRFHGADGKNLTFTKDEESNLNLGPLDLPKDQKDWKQFLCRRVAPPDAATVSVWVHSYAKFKVEADFDEFALAEVSE